MSDGNHFTAGNIQYGSARGVITSRHGGIPRYRRVLLLTLFTGVVLGMLAPSFFITNARAAVVNKHVIGTVYDQADQPIPGAEVVVEIWAGDWPQQDFIRISASTVTNQRGYYEVEISSNYWDPHNTIWVFVTYGLAEEEQKVEADDEEYQRVDLWMHIVIPEFASRTTFLGIMAVTMAIIVRRKQSTRKRP